jgi:hypothetical protein
MSTSLRLFLLATLAGAFTLRLQELTRQDIWWDEARNIEVALRPFLQVATAPELDIHPPLYFWLLHLWNGLAGVTPGAPPGELAFMGRLLSVVAGVAGVALLYPLGARAGGRLAGALAALIGALLPFWLAESQETRMYTVGFALLLAAALALLTGWRGLHAGQSWRQRGVWLPLGSFVVLAAAALLTHYNAVFILVAWYGWWGVWALMQPARGRQLATVVACGLAMTVLVAPVAPIALRQIPRYENPNLTIPTVGDYLWQNWQAYIGGYAFDPALLANNGLLWLWITLALGGLGLLLALMSARGEQRVVLGFLLTWLLGGLALYYIAVLDRNAFNVRYSSFVTPALFALLGVGLAAYARWGRPLAVAGVVVLLAGVAPALQADLYDARFAREDISGVATWLRDQTGPGDVIFVDQKYPFGFYYQPYAIDAGAVLTATDDAAARYLFVDINDVDQRLTEWAGAARRIFWVQWFESDTDPRRAVHFLLDQMGRRAGEQWFQGYAVDWWEMNPPTTFTLAPDLTPTTMRFAGVETVARALPATVQPGQPLPVVIQWQRGETAIVDRPLKVRVALYDGSDARLAQADERLLNDRHRAPAQWQPDDQPLNVYLLYLPPDLPPGDYTVRVLVYDDADTLAPIDLLDAAGNPAGQEATLGSVGVMNQDN